MRHQRPHRQRFILLQDCRHRQPLILLHAGNQILLRRRHLHRRHRLEAIPAQVAADLDHVVRAQKVERVVILDRYHDTLGGGAVHRFQDIQRHPGIAAGVRLFDKLAQRQRFAGVEFFLLRLILHIAVFPAQVMLHPDGESGFRLRSGIHSAQRFAHFLIDTGDLLSARLAGFLNRLQRHLSIVVIIEIFIEELIIAKPHQLRGEVLHRRLLVQFRAGDQPFGYLFPAYGEVGKP